jgi:hypothetical protein
LRAGESFKIAPKTPHAATNTGIPMKLLVTYIVDTNKPLAELPNGVL